MLMAADTLTVSIGPLYLTNLRRLTLLVFLLLSLPTLAASDRLLFYKVQSDKAQMTILGSIHLAPENVYPLRDTITQAFERADTLVVEVDITGDAELEIQQLMLSIGMYPPGETIKDNLTKKTWRQLSKVIQQYGIPPEIMARMRPGVLVTALSSMEMTRLGMHPELGIDRHFLNAAQGKKEIVALETAREQIELLLDFPNTELLVRQTIESLDELDLMMNEMISLWKQGDANALYKLMLGDPLAEYPEFQPVYDRIFNQRNHSMSTKINTLLQIPGTYFVVVGAGHLPGEEGIISLLRKRGSEVEQQ